MTSLSFVSPADTSPPPATTWHYVYGIVRSEEPLLFEISGVDGADEVYTLGEDGLAVVTSDIALPDMHRLGRAEIMQHLSAHQRVIETVQQDYTVLPVKFGTILPDQARLQALLRNGAAQFSEALESFSGKQQFEVVVLWDLAQVFQMIAADETIVALKAQIAGKAPEESINERILAGQLVHAALQQHRVRLSQELIAQLRDLADDFVVNPLMNDTMVVNVALLIKDARREEFEERLDALDQQYGSRLQIRCVGPLPVYSFATLDVQVPSFEAVDAARQQLGLAEKTRYADLKRAFRSLAARYHPDHNQHDEDAAARVDAITGAYRLLSTLARVQAPYPDADDWTCYFGRADVEKSVLLTIVRQESTLQPDQEQ